MDYPQECARLQAIAFQRFKFCLSLNWCEAIWREYSETFAANWLSGASDDEMAGVIETYSKRHELPQLGEFYKEGDYPEKPGFVRPPS